MSKAIFNDSKYASKIEYVNHHIAHAYSTFYPSNYDEALVLILDGQGEYMATSIYKANRENNKMELLMETPISFGYFYSGITKQVGFRNGEEGKTMGLAPYGEPVYYDVLKKYINVDDEGNLNCVFNVKKKSKDEEKETLDKWEEICQQRSE